MRTPARVLVPRGTSFADWLCVRGPVRIEGHVGGEVCGWGSLEVATHARIDGGVRVSRVEVHGLIVGDVVADEVRIGPGGHIEGFVTAQLVEWLVVGGDASFTTSR